MFNAPNDSVVVTNRDESLRSFLDARKLMDVPLVCPPVEYCTDNAAMIAWAGMEMYDEGWTTNLSCQPLRKWSIDPSATDGGILGAMDRR